MIQILKEENGRKIFNTLIGYMPFKVFS